MVPGNMQSRMYLGENHNSKRHMHPSVHSSSIYNSQDMEATQIPHQWRTDLRCGISV